MQTDAFDDSGRQRSFGSDSPCYSFTGKLRKSPVAQGFYDDLSFVRNARSLPINKLSESPAWIRLTPERLFLVPVRRAVETKQNSLSPDRLQSRIPCAKMLPRLLALAHRIPLGSERSGAGRSDLTVGVWPQSSNREEQQNGGCRPASLIPLIGDQIELSDDPCMSAVTANQRYHQRHGLARCVGVDGADYSLCRTGDQRHPRGCQRRCPAK